MSLKSLMSFYQQRINVALEKHLPEINVHPSRLHEAMRYAVLNGGKRVRPLLVYFTGEALGLSAENLDIPAVAVELIHAYSLVHDDLPALDDDDLRRGRATCHRAFDEATAILVGDSLQTLAFYVLTQEQQHITADQRLNMVETLALASGSRGMAGGQMIDLQAVGQNINLAALENMHIHKTGALIRASVKLAAIACADLPPAKFAQLDHYAKCIGLAFQIVDDILDVEACTDVLGKTSGADLQHHKPTYPSLIGLKAAKQQATILLTAALDSLHDFDQRADPLRELAIYVVERKF
jgi:geranylgeranyl pyrophosphate synthase